MRKHTYTLVGHRKVFYRTWTIEFERWGDPKGGRVGYLAHLSRDTREGETLEHFKSIRECLEFTLKTHRVMTTPNISGKGSKRECLDCALTMIDCWELFEDCSGKPTQTQWDNFRWKSLPGWGNYNLPHAVPDSLDLCLQCLGEWSLK